MRIPLVTRKTVAILAVLLGVLLMTAAPAFASPTTDLLDAEFFGPHNSPITGEMVENNEAWYGIDVLPQLVILAAETSLGDPRLGGRLVRFNNFGCIRYHGANTKWGQLADGGVWVAGRYWYSFPSPELGMMGFGRYLKVGADGYYLPLLSEAPYDWRAFAARYYGKNVYGYERYVRNLYAFERRFRAKAAAAGIDW